MRNRNILRCPKCGTEIFTDAKERDCYKCESKMIFVKRENG